MKTKQYSMEHLGCANCAAKMEAKFNTLPEVASADITFATKLLRLTAEDPDVLIPKLERIARSFEDEVRIRPRTHAHTHVILSEQSEGPDDHHDSEHCHEHCRCSHGHDHDHCHCDHDHHEHEHDHNHDHDYDHGDLPSILLGSGLFVAGLLLQLAQLPWIGYAAMALFLLAYGILGWNVLKTAGKNLFKGHIFDENFLMSLATLGALCIGEFPEAVGVMLFYRVGEFFEEKAVARSRSQIMEAADLRPETVNRLLDGDVQVIPAGEARVGDVLLVRPGDRIPLDGVVLTGESPIDTAPITGEPVPVRVCPGDAVTSGCINTTGQLTIQVEKVLSESIVTRILNSVESAAASKPKIDRFITRFARIYTPVVVILAVLTAVVPSLLTGKWDYWVYTALSFLVMSCPCALVLSVPLAFFAGIGVGSRKGILFKGGLSMEAMTKIRAVVMDKTGTLTKGTFQVRQVQGDVLGLCASMEQRSTHPIAVSIVTAAREAGLVLSEPETLEELPGRGIRGILEGKQVLCGNEALLREQGISVPQAQTQPGTLVYVARDGTYLGCIRIADELKPDAAGAVAKLHKQGIETVILTGDGPDAAEAVAKQAGIRRVYAKLLPHEKLERLQALRQELGPVMFVGDGINDAPVLAGADVGAAMGSGADAAIEACDVVFMTGQVEAVGLSLQIAARTNRIAWQNVVFALAVKLVVMVLGLLGFSSMWLAVFADSGVAMLCVLNSIRMLYRRRA